MLKPYHFSFLAAILIMVSVVVVTGTGFRTKKQYGNMWKNEYKSEYVVFASTRDGNYEIYSMNPDGSESSRLTNDPADDYNPSISPDGLKIAFTSHRDGNYEIYSMNFDGSDQVRLTHSSDDDNFPAWSPDGTRIAYTSLPIDGTSDIYVMNVDGTDPINITNSPGNDLMPSWSPDGAQIVFVSSRDDPNMVDPISRIYIMNADGTNPRRLIDYESRWPAWSPDGTKIAFVSYPGLHVFDLFSQTDTVLVTDPEVDGKVAWSPDGQEILFTSSVLIGFIAIEREHGQLYRVSAAGSAPIQITFGASNGNADWKGAIASQSNPTFVVENTATVETITPTDIPEIEETETAFPTPETSEMENTAIVEVTPTETIVETQVFTATLEVGSPEILLSPTTPSPIDGEIIVDATQIIDTPAE